MSELTVAIAAIILCRCSERIPNSHNLSESPNVDIGIQEVRTHYVTPCPRQPPWVDDDFKKSSSHYSMCDHI